MGLINFDEMFTVILNLPDGKAAGLSGISNELWKHCDKSVLDMFLKEVWVSMIPKPYKWEGVLMNTCPIALIETACKVFSKILSDRISLACSNFDVLCGDNFSVLRGTSTHSPIFAVGSVVEDALKKNQELWLVLIKMCSKFIHFFGNIYRDRTNRVMTDFGLTDGYQVHDGLNQREVFSPLLWHIFYNPFLYEVKKQESMCKYRLNSYFIFKTGHAEFQAGHSSFFTAGVFMDDTIWIGSSQVATQHILNMASKFFWINNISINNDKTVVISINCWDDIPSLFISGSLISIAKKGESHRYLSIFLSTEGLSKPSLAKAHLDVRFFTNFVLRKAISDKQFSYLVSSVLYPIVCYRTQFSFGLKSKSGLSLDFSNDALHHPFLYTLVVSFANSVGILDHLFSHKAYDLQVLNWCSFYPLCFPAHVKVPFLNNFLAGIVRIFLDYNLSFSNSMASAFCFWNGTFLSSVLSESCFVSCQVSLRHYGIVFVEQLFHRDDSRGPIPCWFDLVVDFLRHLALCFLPSHVVDNLEPLNILKFSQFDTVHNNLLSVEANSFSVYTDGSVAGLGTTGMRAGTVAFFEDVGMGLEIEVSDLVSLTLVELQAIVLALECVPLSNLVILFSDSQAALDAYKLELVLVHPDFRYSGVLDNDVADMLTNLASSSGCFLPSHLEEHFILANGNVVSSNAKHFARDIFQSIHRAHWEVGSGLRIIADNLLADIDWYRSSLVWHSDLHMAAGFISKYTAGAHSYFMKALHHQLPVVICKHLYNKCYLSVVCLFCGNVKISDHVFTCVSNTAVHACLLDSHAAIWKSLSGLVWSSLCVMQLMLPGASNGVVFTVFCCLVIEFVWDFCLAFRDKVWLVHAKHRALMKKNGLIPKNGSILVSVSGLFTTFSTGVVKLLGISEAFGVSFGLCKACLFFSGIGNLASVYIGA
ncbi:hypothetical protein G9A89_001941 [Geosiphon pyriformis]|nr:hypothetical protein G9A89_001941 [Geosiphon pyriformis]